VFHFVSFLFHLFHFVPFCFIFVPFLFHFCFIFVSFLFHFVKFYSTSHIRRLFEDVLRYLFSIAGVSFVQTVSSVVQTESSKYRSWPSHQKDPVTIVAKLLDPLKNWPILTFVIETLLYVWPSFHAQVLNTAEAIVGAAAAMRASHVHIPQSMTLIGRDSEHIPNPSSDWSRL
jgi:hypothetical protein